MIVGHKQLLIGSQRAVAIHKLTVSANAKDKIDVRMKKFIKIRPAWSSATEQAQKDAEADPRLRDRQAGQIIINTFLTKTIPGATRTHNLWLRRPTLYPIELRGRLIITLCIIGACLHFVQFIYSKYLPKCAPGVILASACLSKLSIAAAVWNTGEMEHFY